MLSFITSHKFSLNIALIGISGIIIPELANWDHAAKILASLITSIILVDKWLKDRKKRKR